MFFIFKSSFREFFLFVKKPAGNKSDKIHSVEQVAPSP